MQTHRAARGGGEEEGGGNGGGETVVDGGTRATGGVATGVGAEGIDIPDRKSVV